MTRRTRQISWIKAARRDFEKFPAEAQTICLTALTIAAENGKADIAKPMMRLLCLFEATRSALSIAVQLGTEIWVIHAFQKKSKHGIETPQQEIELVNSRLKALKKMLG